MGVIRGREKYVDGLTVYFREYDGIALPENFRSETSFSVDVSGFVKSDDLVDTLEAKLRPAPFILDQKWVHFSWGAESASLIVIIATALGGIASATVIIEAIAKIVGKLGRSQELSADAVIQRVRASLSESLDVAPGSVAIDVLEKTKNGFRSVARVGKKRYDVQVDNAKGVVELRTVK